MSFAVSSLQNNYTYMSQGLTKPRLDNNSDGLWSKTEMDVYASAYNRATGGKLDADKIMSTYDADKDGFLSASEQETLNKDDALGLEKLFSTKSSSDSDTAQADLNGLMEGMASRNKVAFANAIFKSENQSRLWENFSTAGSGSFGDFNSIISGQMAYKAYAAAGVGGANSRLGEYGLSPSTSMNMWL